MDVKSGMRKECECKCEKNFLIHMHTSHRSVKRNHDKGQDRKKESHSSGVESGVQQGKAPDSQHFVVNKKILFFCFWWLIDKSGRMGESMHAER